MSNIIFTENELVFVTTSLKKQISKTPQYTYDECYECPNCYTPIEEISFYKNGKKKFKNPAYCFECGQKLDWEGTK